MKQLVRLIPPKWLKKSVIEGELTSEEITRYNQDGFNVFFRPNYPSVYTQGTNVDGSQIDKWEYVFVDYDLKSNVFESKDAFIESLADFDLVPSKIVDSGNGVHVYWQILDLDAMSYLRIQRRLVRRLKTDEATCNLGQLMRLPGTVNTKDPNNLKLCELLYDEENIYTCEQMDKALPQITQDDEKFCQTHYNRTYNLTPVNLTINETLPPKFGKLMLDIPEVKELWANPSTDRSKADFRLAHLLFANGFTKDEARSVLVNAAKALERAPIHRIGYADSIIDKIWTYEKKGAEDLSDTVESILQKSDEVPKGTPFRCHPRIDNTVHGFRLGQVVGLVAGSGVGKTSFTMNMFLWFTQQNPDYHHFFVSLEMQTHEIADRWQTMCGKDTSLHSKVHVVSNYDSEGNYRNLSLEDIKKYILEWQTKTGKKVGTVVIDHIGILRKSGANDENQDLITLCHSMKSFAVQTNTLLIMQSQTTSEKAGIGDLELNKDAAYGTSQFSWYCDFMITMWQPLKRCHSEESCPTITAFKFCKIRNKKPRRDIIKEDVPYYFYFDSETELMRDMTQEEKTSFNYFLSKATNARKQDRKTDIIAYQSVPYQEGGVSAAKFISPSNSSRH
jgi:hypothetical protein